MAKVLLVEDDDNLRGIYGDRLGAEGYQILSAKDGEEALAIAVKERPDLIISDIMMPKISGFDMLDILRNNPETKDTKVIMMTALSQKEDQERGQKLGADRYLVKSQVTLEDVVRVTAEVLAETKPATVTVAPAASSAEAPTPVVAPPLEAVPPVATAPIVQPAAPPTPVVTSPVPATPVAVPTGPIAAPVEPVLPPTPVAGPSTIESVAVGGQRVIQPIDQTIATPIPDINQLYEAELAKEQTPISPDTESNKVTPPSQTPPAPGSNPSDIAL